LKAVILLVLIAQPIFAHDMTAKNKMIARKLVEKGLVKGNLSVIDEYVAEDAVNHSAPHGMPSGQGGIRQLFKMLRNALPDLRIKIDDVIAENDKVVQRVTLTCTMKGKLMGISPTGKKAPGWEFIYWVSRTA
jgi:predicted ester cyclase